MAAGPEAFWIASCEAARLLSAQQSGLIAAISEPMIDPDKYDLAESPEYTGRAVAALASDQNLIAKSGQLIFVGDAACEYGFTDIDGHYIENFYRATGRL